MSACSAHRNGSIVDRYSEFIDSGDDPVLLRAFYI
jgi:hypothetical protein